jgi:hypothetical protein
MSVKIFRVNSPKEVIVRRISVVFFAKKSRQMKKRRCVIIIFLMLDDMVYVRIIEKNTEIAMSITADRDKSGDLETLVNRAVQGKERVKIIQEGKPGAAIIPIDDLALLEDLEDRLDTLEALEALEEARIKGGVKTWERFAAELGLLD